MEEVMTTKRSSEARDEIEEAYHRISQLAFMLQVKFGPLHAGNMLVGIGANVLMEGLTKEDAIAALRDAADHLETDHLSPRH